MLFTHWMVTMLLHIGTSNASSVTMTASCLCSMLIDLTSEEFLLSCSEFDAKTLGSLSELIVRSLQQDVPDDDGEQFNQKQVIVSGYRRWADRFPHVKNVVDKHVSVWSFFSPRYVLHEWKPANWNLKAQICPCLRYLHVTCYWFWLGDF